MRESPYNVERDMDDLDQQRQQADDESQKREQLYKIHVAFPPFAESVGSKLQKAPSRCLLRSRELSMLCR